MRKLVTIGIIILLIVPFNVLGKELILEDTTIFGGSNDDYVYQIKPTNDGGYIAVGSTASTDINGLTNKGSNDGLLIKYDSTNNIKWKITYGATDFESFNRVIETTSGDIIAVAKLSELEIGYTLCEKKAPVVFDKPEYSTPIYYVAIKPKNKQDEEKISSALHKIKQEDPTFEFKRNPETAQLLIGGQGVLHIGYIVDKLKNIFKVEVTQEDPKVVYRETIRGRTTGDKGVQGRHKKQSGGAGQFGDVWIKFEPTSEPFEFHEEVFGGAVPKNYFPAVEKGLQKALEKGPLAGFPVIGVKATLVDGSYHPVDSNELSFVLAAGLAWQAAIKEVKPTILEPIMELLITVKTEHVGAVMGDMSKRRGRILGQEEIGNGKTLVTAEVPESEIAKYATELKTMTQASGRFERRFLRYDITPEDQIKKIIAEYKEN